eukprot:Clim_evm75s210 gene=Clim_evmTU75s210
MGDAWDSWEDAADAGALTPEPPKKVKPNEWNFGGSVGDAPANTIIKADEKPKMKILKRNVKQNSSETDQELERAAKDHAKSLKQREKDYAAARARIFGSGTPSPEPGSEGRSPDEKPIEFRPKKIQQRPKNKS